MAETTDANNNQAIHGKQLGPDFALPTDEWYSTSLRDPVKLRISEANKRFEPMSIYTMFKNTVDERPDFRALAYKKSSDPKGPWQYVTFAEYWANVHTAAKSFIKLGFEAHQTVGILGFNTQEWLYALLGAQMAGGVGCGMYATNSAEACAFQLKDSGAKIVVVENKKQLDKIVETRAETGVQKVIVYSEEVKEEDRHDGLVISWKEFINLGSSESDESELEARIKGIAPNRCASLIYTSGTTGNPKAAMISHDNCTYVARFFPAEVTRMKRFNERVVSFLPLSHIAAQFLDVYTAIKVGVTVYFCQPDALKGTLNVTMKEVRPTFFFGVPRVWEKMQDKLESVLGKLTGVKAFLLDKARSLATDQINYEFSGQAPRTNMSFYLAKTIMLSKIHAELGLDQCVNVFSGAASISQETLSFFHSLGLPLAEVFGLSETTGPHTCGVSYKNAIKSIGPIEGLNQSKLFPLDTNPIANLTTGELICNGRHIFMGYLNNVAKTNETFGADHWFHTGDVAKFENGFIFITGRIKEIIITAGGENVPPVPIEEKFKTELPKLVSNCMIIGEKRKYLTILITLRTVINLDTMEPTDDLAPECIEYLKAEGSTHTSLKELLASNDELVNTKLEKAMKAVNATANSNAQKIQKFLILPRDFSLPTGELGPTLKLRRLIVNSKYESEINNLYE
jgi:long-chain-fatty-acid--CoA ligase ACSBG